MPNLNLSQLTDEQIARLVQAGKIENFGELVKRYEAKMKRYAKKFLFAYEDAEDVVQEVFIKAYTNIQSFNSSKKFSPWLYRIAHNEFINAIKKRGKESLSFFNFDTLLPNITAKDNIKDEIDRQELRAVLNKCLDKIAPKYREPLVLYYFEGFSYKEIAGILRIPVSTVGIRLKRGKKLMKSLLPKTI
ncbi:MAG: RNA polymerase sigma factor [Candidatus Jacksonbacteria bacterium]